MSRDVILRPARPEDAAQMSEVFLAAWRETLSAVRRVHTDDEVRTWIREVVVSTTTVWVAEKGGEVVGFFSLDVESLEHMYVHPDFQGIKVGEALLHKARELSPRRLELYTFARNVGARRFYERHGFRAIAFGEDNEENEPDVLYVWTSEAGKPLS